MMNSQPSTRLIMLLISLFPWVTASSVRGDWQLEQMLGKDQQGRTIYRSRPVPKSLVNVWPSDLEQQFQARARMTIAAQAKIKSGVNTYFENEKRSYGFLMAHLLSEDPEKFEASLKAIQARDHQHQEWHKETSGIDYYAAFTIKHQMRKYFYFGDLLEPEYRRLMFEGARQWTAEDPLRRPHYAYQGPKPGWGPDAKNSWVDVRSTENLFLMRVTSVYLMAETTGNRQTTEKYKRLLLDYTATLFRIGIGEWDSENYLGHSIAPLLNLYDFAEDPTVKAAAKACLDFYFIAGAIKYDRGGFNGPTKRDYNHAQPFGGSAANMLWLMFGNPENKRDHWESDEVHLITSAYRAPLVAVELARKNFTRPVVLYASKPHYSATTSLDRDSQPAYLETQYFGKTFQMGSLAGGTRPGKDDVNGFKILSTNQQGLGVVIQGVPGNDPRYVGSPQYQEGKVAGENRVAQYNNLAIWLVQQGNSDWSWVVPDDFRHSQQEQVCFLRGPETWIALTPLGTAPFKPDATAARKLESEKERKFPGHYVITARGTGDNFCGVAIEVGDRHSHESFDQFVSDVLAAEVDVTELDKGIAKYKAASGQWLGFHWNDKPHDLGVWKNGTRHDFQEHARYLYQASNQPSLVESRWGTGELRVNTARYRYHCRVDASGKVEWESDPSGK